ncbi:MAG: hypothetical protein WBD36_10890 [Bacteroidota bacterium]
MRRIAIILLTTSALGFSFLVHGQDIDWKNYDPRKATPEEAKRVNEFLENNLKTYFGKTAGDPREIKSWIMRGNKITTIVYNYGNIARPSTLGNVADLVWNRLGYGFEFTPLVAAKVLDSHGDTVHILDDGMWLSTQGGYSPDGTLKWGWLPKAGYSAPGQADIAAWSQRSQVAGDLTRKPSAWPESWYNSILGRYVWPAFLGNDATTPDEEVYFVCDDYTNQKYLYYPFPSDSTKRGLGLDLEVRFFQFNNPLAEDIVFLVYRVTNKSPKTLNEVYFGMHGDPHVGGPADYADDRAFFIPPRGSLADPFPQRARSMVYAWDDDGKGDGGLKPGYFGFKFLESPTNSEDGIDNDDDGIIDESPFNDAGTYIDGITKPLTTGIADTAKYIALFGSLKPRWSGDEDGDWDPAKDDVGFDGIAGTGDFGEGNGKPDVGYDINGNFTSEPNFGIRDVHESDQIGLTSFYALPYTNSLPNVPKNDVLYWQLLSSDSISIDQTLLNSPGDNVFVYGSGPFRLDPSGTQRFSIALLMGVDLPDLLLNSETSQRILEANYRFAQPPPKPNVVAIPGDHRVTLYWDNVSENSIDPLTAVNDFEGYKIYRSEDPTFVDVFMITDANGTPFLGKPFLQNGIPAQFDLVNEWSGLHPVEYLGRGVKYQLGSNSGLVHQYVDSSAMNGKTYYYAVVSYDHGFDSLGVQLPPTESQAVILQDPITSELSFDVNTAAVTPAPLPLGVSSASITEAGVTRVSGNSTGTISVKVMNDRVVAKNQSYLVNFTLKNSQILYSVFPKGYTSEKIVANDTFYVNLSHTELFADSVQVLNASGAVVSPTAYVVDAEKGRIRGSTTGSLPKDATFEVRYQYYSVHESDRLSSQDDNPVFDGLRIYAKDEPLGIDSVRSGWLIKNNTNVIARVAKNVALNTNPFTPIPADFEIRWNATDTSASGKWLFPADTLLDNLARRVVVCPFKIFNVTNSQTFRGFVQNSSGDSTWRLGREIVILTPANPIKTYMGITFSKSPNGSTVLPTQGNIYVAKTTKPFATGDSYTFTSKASEYNESTTSSSLDRIYVVPNPYVAFSDLETPGSSATRRGDNRLQFRNLPPKCTIRIYTLIGELVATIDKDDSNSYADWNLLSYEGQRLSYGVYIYHVEVPGVGNKIGRLALIK